MEFNEINKNVSYTTMNNPTANSDKIDNKNKIQEINIDLHKPELKGNADSRLNTPNIDKTDISNTATKRAKEKAFAENGNADSQNSSAINSTYMSQIIKKGKEIEKPSNVNMDDVSWGLLVQLGEKIGLTKADKLAKLTVKDVEAYFYNKHVIERGKELTKETLTANEYAALKGKKMDNKAYWDMVFEAKANNKQYTIPAISQRDTGLSLAPQEFFSHNSSSITKLSASSLHNILMAEENSDVAQFQYAIKSLTYAKKYQTLEQIQNDMIKSYDAMQEYSLKLPSSYEQIGIIKSTIKNGNLTIYKV